MPWMMAEEPLYACSIGCYFNMEGMVFSEYVIYFFLVIAYSIEIYYLCTYLDLSYIRIAWHKNHLKQFLLSKK